MTIRPIAAHVNSQIEELLTRYGKIDLLWFDGKPAAGDNPVISIERIRQLQPGIVINPRLHGQGDYITFVIDEDGVRGYVCIGPVPLTQGVYDLYWIVVDAAARGRQYGQRLLRFAEEEVKRRAGRMVLIETSSLPAYEGTRRFYLAAGYPEVARIANFYKPGDDKIIYGKNV